MLLENTNHYGISLDSYDPYSLYCCRYIFPGLALGAALGQTGVVTNAMINRAAEALVELINEDDLARYILDISTLKYP